MKMLFMHENYHFSVFSSLFRKNIIPFFQFHFFWNYFLVELSDRLQRSNTALVFYGFSWKQWEQVIQIEKKSGDSTISFSPRRKENDRKQE